MLNSPNRDGDEPGRLSRRVFRQSLYSDFGSLWKTGGTGSRKNRERLQSIPYLDITLGTIKIATFLLRTASESFIFHWRRSWPAPAAPAERLAASRPRVRACRSRFRTGGRPGGRTFRFPG